MKSAPDPRCKIGRIKPKGNITLFPGVKAPDVPVNRQPNAPTIALLRDALAKAECGEITGVAAVLVLDTGNTMHNWAGADHSPVSVLLGGLTLLSDDISSASLRATPELVDYDK